MWDHMVPTFSYNFCIADMWVPFFLIIFPGIICHINATLDEDLVKGNHVDATSSKTRHTILPSDLFFCTESYPVLLG